MLPSKKKTIIKKPTEPTENPEKTSTPAPEEPPVKRPHKQETKVISAPP